MKKLFLFAAVVAAFCSCTTVKQTATTIKAPSQLLSATVADLDVAPGRATSTLKTTGSIRRGGFDNIRRTAEAKCLAENGNADLLVEPEYTTKRKIKFSPFPHLIVSEMTVSGRPAKYTGFHSLNDSVWCNPEFRSRYKNTVSE